MRLTRDNMHVVTAEWDSDSLNHWYKIIIDLPQLHLETPPFHTSEFGHDLIDMIVKQDDKCPNCGGNI